ncbi:MAG: hypothetical protein ACD_50C00175G0004 [uncultured bacterium]|nr:MAG: hypothetical protein ACD_50C00175G0004 [uncultured bacterium]OGH13601.1 MAG: hypothetical protein A2687_05565 [Candidatus Levybacteria bacterium RIFCSPHIGHO2_01_FULL_38_26]
MKVKQIITLFLFLSGLYMLAGLASAQSDYSPFIEKIHYNHISRGIGPHDPYDAKKAIGSDNPTLIVYIWGDLNERYTKMFFDNIFETLKDKYSNEALFVYNHRAFLMQDRSIRAGMIGECVAQEGQFWNNIKGITNNLDNLDSLDYLENIDRGKIESCLNDPYTKTVIEVSENDGKFLGFNTIPTIVIKNIAKPQQYSIKVMGAQNISVFERAFLEAKEGDLSNTDLVEVKEKVTDLEQDVQKTKEDVEETKEDVEEIKEEQSRLAQEIEKLRGLIQSIIEKIQNFFGIRS